MPAAIPQTDRTTLKRLPDRGSYERKLIDSILDEALFCHLGFNVDGQPFVVPTIHARVGDDVYVHGSVASRMLRQLGHETPMCLTATLIDGLVVARAAFHHSMNYRSVMLLGVPRVVTDPAEKAAALRAVVEHVVPGRSDDLRENTDVEIRQTTVLALKITEGSAKVRTGDPKDDEPDMALDVWAGVLPLRLTPGEPIAAADLRAGIATPGYLSAYQRIS